MYEYQSSVTWQKNLDSLRVLLRITPYTRSQLNLAANKKAPCRA